MTSTLTIPQVDLDPYTDESIADPYLLYEALRDAALHRHDTFVSGEGVGLTDTLTRRRRAAASPATRPTTPTYADSWPGI
ncbi:hypothetical protein [Streptomyces tendae]|uniref:hypothetical protein n=1 Tax=Streptomyces tendae TaxID=1932 RepID=UPI00381C6A59